MKKEYITNLWMQGLLMAIVVAGAVSLVDPAFAQLDSTINSTDTHVFNPIIKVLTWGCYVIAMLLGIGGIMKLHAHSTNPSSTPLNHGVVRLACAAILGAIPSLIGMLSQTSSQTMTGSFAPGQLITVQ